MEILLGAVIVILVIKIAVRTVRLAGKAVSWLFDSLEDRF